MDFDHEICNLEELVLVGDWRIDIFKITEIIGPVVPKINQLLAWLGKQKRPNAVSNSAHDKLLEQLFKLADTTANEIHAIHKTLMEFPSRFNSVIFTRFAHKHLDRIHDHSVLIEIETKAIDVQLNQETRQKHSDAIVNMKLLVDEWRREKRYLDKYAVANEGYA